MAGVFQDVELEWQERVYTVPARKVMPMICKIEDVITLQEFERYAVSGSVPIGRLCCAYGAALRYAGAPVGDDEIYDVAFRGAEEQQALGMAVTNLMKLMLPPAARQRLEEHLERGGDDPASEDIDPGNGKATAANGQASKTGNVSASRSKPSARRSQKRAG
jgi:hypothetical protein